MLPGRQALPFSQDTLYFIDVKIVTASTQLFFYIFISKNEIIDTFQTRFFYR